jgi:hypothetical protein
MESRREIHAATAQTPKSDAGMKQMLMPYRNKRNKLAAIEPGFEFKPGFIYTQVRAISARINQNYDAWPSEELKKSYRTFINRPVFVNHQNFDYKKARGKVVAARYLEAGDDRYVETVMEIDAQRFPKLAHEIKTGGLDSVSMGVEAGFTKCSICDNKAVDVPEFCAHVKYHKGSYLPHVKTGRSTLVYENCLTPDMRVLMDGGVNKRIADVVVGDRVIDHLGQPRLVTEAHSRLVNEDIYKIHRYGNWLDVLELTGNHPVLSVRSEQASYPSGAFSRDRFVRELEVGRVRPEFVEASQVREGDWVCEVIPRTEGTLQKIVTAEYIRTPGHHTRWSAIHTLPDTLELTGDLGLFVGWFLSEGSVNKNRTQVDFGLHGDEAEQADGIVALAQRCFGLTSTTTARYGNSLRVTIFSAPLAQLMSIFGTSSATKALPDAFMSAPVEFLAGVLRAHELGDGLHGNEASPLSQRKDNVRQHVHYHFTASKMLAEQLYRIHLMLGNTPSHSTRDDPNYEHWLPMHKVWWKSAKGSKGKMSYGPWTFTRVRKIESEPYSGSVYNLEVEGTHTYTAEGMAVHNCYKLGFFELSYVFDPADETAVVSRVIAASNKNAAAEEPPQDEIVEGEMPTGQMPTAALERRINRLAYGEVEAPEDIDTLRDESEDDTDDFKHYVESPEELKAPNLDRTQQLDRTQEGEGLDTPRRVEQVEDVGGHFIGQDPVKDDRHDIEEIKLMAAHRGPATLVDPRTGRRYYAADEDEQGPPPDFGGGDDSGDEGFPTDDGGSDDFGGGDDGGDAPDGGDGKSDEELLQEAEDDLQQAEDAGAGHDPTEEFGDGSDDGDFGDYDDEQGADSADDFPGDDGEADAGGGDDLPPWLGGGGDDGPPPDEDMPPREARRRRANDWSGPGKFKHLTDPRDKPGYGERQPGEVRREEMNDDEWDKAVGHSYAKDGTRRARRNAQKGRPMSLSQRNRVASAGRRRHYADESGHTDGSPYGNNDEQQGDGEQINEVYGDGVPSSEAVAAPTPGDGTISNTENNLVARKLYQKIQAQNAEIKRNLIAYEQVTGTRIAGTRRKADDGNWPNPSEQSISGAESPDEVDPALSGTDEQGLKGDFDSIALDKVETQPKDASVRAFKAFDQWLATSTGRTARQHGNPNFIRRSAAQFCSAKKISVESLFPTLGSVLREARKNERSATMRRRAEAEIEFAAPQDRIDVEAPVRNVTDAEAQASQYSPSDFGDNAGDNLADPELSTDSQIWAPGEGDSAANSSKRDANRKADGMTAVRYAEAYIAAGLAPNTPEEKWRIAGLAQMMRHATIVDRIGMCEAFAQVHQARQASARRTAGVNGGSRIPQGVSNRQMTAGTNHTAGNDTANDFALFMKG